MVSLVRAPSNSVRPSATSRKPPLKQISIYKKARKRGISPFQFLGFEQIFGELTATTGGMVQRSTPLLLTSISLTFMTDFDDELSFDLSGLQDDAPVFLSIRPGDGDVQHSVFKDFTGKFVTGSVQNYPLGMARDVRGRQLLTTTLVTDTNPITNRTSLRFVVNDQKPDAFIADANEDNGSVSYNILLKF